MFFTTHYASALIAEGKAAGMVLACRDDREIAMFFDGEDERQARTAIRFIKARRERQFSDEQRKVAAERLGRFRELPGMPFPAAKPTVEARSQALSARIGVGSALSLSTLTRAAYARQGAG